MSIPTVPARFNQSEGDPTVSMHIVLVEPEIPPNTGSIARLCAATGTWLHLVRPFAFELSDKHLRRAGLDYWPSVQLSVHESLEVLCEMLPWARPSLFSKKASALHFDVAYPEAPVLVFGKESKGLPEPFIDAHLSRTVRIPTTGEVRSLNLAQAAAIGAYEVIRQHGLCRDTLPAP